MIGGSSKSIKVQLMLTAVDKMSSVVNKATNLSKQKLIGLSRRSKEISQNAFQFGRQSLMVGGAILASITPSINAAQDFQAEMSNISTLVDTNTESMRDMSVATLNFAKRMPLELNDITESLYDIRSASIPAAQSMEVLEASGKLAVSGLGTAKEATNIMTSSINAFAKENLSAAEISDILFKTVKYGKTTVSELSQSFGSVASVISGAGVKLADFQAATAALTTSGRPASQAQNQLRAGIVSLQKPSQKMIQVLKALGVTSGRELIAKMGSVGAAFKAVTDTTKALGYELENVTIRVEATSAMKSLADEARDKYLNAYQEITGGANAINDAFDKQMTTARVKMQKAKNNIKVSMIKMGSVVLPLMAKIYDKVSKFASKIGDWIEIHPRRTAMIIKFAAAFGGLLIFLGSIALVVGVVTSGFSAILLVASALGPVITFLSNVFMMLEIILFNFPIIGWIALIITAIYLLYKNWDEVVAYFQNIWSQITAGFDKGFVQGMMVLIKNINPMTHIIAAMDWIVDYLFGFSLIDAGNNIIDSLIDGIKFGLKKLFPVMTMVTGVIRDHLPFSPAKIGPLKTLHKVRIVETIADAIKPNLIRPKMNQLATVMAQTPSGSYQSSSNYGSASSSVNYSPTINITGGGGKNVAESIMEVLQRHKSEITRIVNNQNSRDNNLNY